MKDKGPPPPPPKKESLVMRVVSFIPFCCLQDWSESLSCFYAIFHQNDIIDWAWERVLRVPPFGPWKLYIPSGRIRCKASLGSLQADSGLCLVLLCPLVGLYVGFTFLNKVIDMKEFSGWRQQPQRTPSLKSAKGKHMEPSKECSNKNWNIWQSLPSPLYFCGIIVSRRGKKQLFADSKPSLWSAVLWQGEPVKESYKK